MVLAENKKARFDYEILDTFVTGIVLLGWEVKSIRSKNISMKASWVKVTDDGELFLENVVVALWKNSSVEQDTNRKRKLLITKKEISRIKRKIREKKLTLVPLKIFTQGRYLKCEIALAKGKKRYEKKQVLKNRDQERSIKREISFRR